jgi:uncharacterized protein YndB with AHSA1/START domain
MNSEPRAIIRVTRRFAASPERVFDAWLDPANAGKWLFATPSGQMVRVEIDPRIGGRFNFVDRRDGKDIEHSGEYHELDRPRRLVFTFSLPKYASESTRVNVDIVPIGTGCELTLSHESVYQDYVSRTEAGWAGILDGLAAALDRTASAR